MLWIIFGVLCLILLGRGSSSKLKGGVVVIAAAALLWGLTRLWLVDVDWFLFRPLGWFWVLVLFILLGAVVVLIRLRASVWLAWTAVGVAVLAPLVDLSLQEQLVLTLLGAIAFVIVGLAKGWILVAAIAVLVAMLTFGVLHVLGNPPASDLRADQSGQAMAPTTVPKQSTSDCKNQPQQKRWATADLRGVLPDDAARTHVQLLARNASMLHSVAQQLEHMEVLTDVDVPSGDELVADDGKCLSAAGRELLKQVSDVLLGDDTLRGYSLQHLRPRAGYVVEVVDACGNVQQRKLSQHVDAGRGTLVYTFSNEEVLQVLARSGKPWFVHEAIAAMAAGGSGFCRSPSP